MSEDQPTIEPSAEQPAVTAVPEVAPAATEPVSPQAAAEAKAGRRMRRRERSAEYRSARTRAIAMALVALALLVACVPFGWKAVSARLGATARLDEAYALAKAADPTVIEIDAVIGATIQTSTAEQASAAAAKLPAARDDLERVNALVDEAWPNLNDDERKQGKLLKEAATARLAMLAAGEPLLAANEQAALALGPMRTSWASLLEAQRLSALAAAQYNKLTKTSVRASDRYLSQVTTGLAGARKGFSEAATAFPALDVKAHLSYVAQREKLLALAKQSNAAFLKGDPAKANSVSSQYNALDKQAAAAAAKLPASPERAIAAAFEEITKADALAYAAARKRAEDADRKIKGQ